MADTTYSAYCTRKWTPSGSSYTKQYRARIDTTLNNQPTYCQISYTGYINLTSSVTHTHNWSRGGTGISGSGTVKTTVGEAKTVQCCSGSSSRVNKTHSAQTITASLTIWSSSSGGSNTWNGEKVTATKTYTVPALTNKTVTYDANGGTGTFTEKKWYSETLYLSNGATLSRDGYTLLRWNTASDGSGTNYEFGQAYQTEADLYLYAVWQKNPSCTPGASTGSPYYTGKASLSVPISNVTTYGGATVSSIVLQLGTNVSSAITGNGTLSITPTVAGTFTPLVTITDSTTASTTYTLPNVTVKQYSVPTVQFIVDRTEPNGRKEETNGVACVITASFTGCRDAYAFQAPTVTCNGSNNGLTITWYTTRDTYGVVTGAVDWSNVTNNQIVYGLITAPTLSTSVAYTISIIPRDTRSSGIEKTQVLPAAVYPIDVFAEGGGIAFGRIATADGLFCKMIATFEDDVILSLNDTVSSGTDADILTALSALGWLNQSGELI